jgi:hypothetical protein
MADHRSKRPTSPEKAAAVAAETVSLANALSGPERDVLLETAAFAAANGGLNITFREALKKRLSARVRNQDVLEANMSTRVSKVLSDLGAAVKLGDYPSAWRSVALYSIAQLWMDRAGGDGGKDAVYASDPDKLARAAVAVFSTAAEAGDNAELRRQVREVAAEVEELKRKNASLSSSINAVREAAAADARDKEKSLGDAGDRVRSLEKEVATAKSLAQNKIDELAMAQTELATARTELEAERNKSKDAIAAADKNVSEAMKSISKLPSSDGLKTVFSVDPQRLKSEPGSVLLELHRRVTELQAELEACQGAKNRLEGQQDVAKTVAAGKAEGVDAAAAATSAAAAAAAANPTAIVQDKPAEERAEQSDDEPIETEVIPAAEGAAAVVADTPANALDALARRLGIVAAKGREKSRVFDGAMAAYASAKRLGTFEGNVEAAKQCAVAYVNGNKRSQEDALKTFNRFVDETGLDIDKVQGPVISVPVSAAIAGELSDSDSSLDDFAM